MPNTTRARLSRRPTPMTDDHSPMTDDRGAVTAFFAVAVLAMLVLVGLVVDGGDKARALARADRIAAEAARAGGQAIDVPAAIQGSAVRVNTTNAVRAAQAYLRAAHVTGTVTPTANRRGLIVTVTVTQPTVFLKLAGVSSYTVRSTAEATLVSGVTGVGR